MIDALLAQAEVLLAREKFDQSMRMFEKVQQQDQQNQKARQGYQRAQAAKKQVRFVSTLCAISATAQVTVLLSIVTLLSLHCRLPKRTTTKSLALRVPPPHARSRRYVQTSPAKHRGPARRMSAECQQTITHDLAPDRHSALKPSRTILTSSRSALDRRSMT